MDMVAYALSVVKSSVHKEPCTYKEVFTNREFTLLIVTMNEKIESLQKTHT